MNEEYIKNLRYALEESSSLLVAMLFEQRPKEEIENQIIANRKAINSYLNNEEQ